MFVSLHARNLCEVCRIMVAETFLLRAEGCPLPAWITGPIVFTWSARPMGLHPPLFSSLPCGSLDFPGRAFLMRPGSSCSPFALLCIALVLEHPPQPSSFWAAPGSSFFQLFWCLSTVCLCLGPVRQAVYGGVLPVCCPAEAGRNSDGKSPAFGATV